MMKFFRTFRKKLIEADNVRKYLLYSVGEILLVVIGILIALQVNNWNEERKNSIAVNQYIESILQDIDKDVEALTTYRNLMLTDSITTAHFQKRILAPEASIDTLKQIARYEYLIAVRTMPPLFNTTFQAMNSSGDIQLLNKKTAEKLQRYYANKSELMEVYSSSMDDYATAVNSYMEHIPTSEAEFVFDLQFINPDQADEMWKDIDEYRLALSFNKLATYRSVISSLSLMTIRPFLKEAEDLQDYLITEYPSLSSTSK